MFREIFAAARKGWIVGGDIQWRQEFVDKNIHPDRFLDLPGAEGMLASYLRLPKQARVIFLNTLERRYTFLRVDE